MLLITFALTACLISEEDTEDDISDLGEDTTTDAVEEDHETSDSDTTTVFTTWVSSLENTTWAYDIRASGELFFCQIESGKKVAAAKGSITGNQVQWSSDQTSTFIFSDGSLSEEINGVTTTYSAKPWPAECDANIFTGVWSSTSGDDVWNYHITDEGSLTFCQIQAGSLFSIARSAFNPESFTVDWPNDSQSEFSVTAEQVLVESFDSTTSAYTPSTWPEACDTNPFLGTWSFTTGTSSYYYDFSEGSAVRFCYVEDGALYALGQGTYGDFQISWSEILEERASASQLYFTEGKLVEFYEDLVTEYSQDQWPTVCD